MSKFEEWWKDHAEDFIWNFIADALKVSPKSLSEASYLAGQASLAAEMGEVEKQATEMAWLIWDRSCFKHADGWDEPFSDGWSVVPFLLSHNLIEKHPEREWYRRITGSESQK